MVKVLTITEARLLPGGIALFLIIIGSLVFLSDAPKVVQAWVAGGMFLGALWPCYRCLRPRWVLRLDNKKLWFHDLSARRVTEVELSSVTNVSIRKTTTFGVCAEGGVGFQNELVLESEKKVVTLPLPILEISAAKAAELVKANLSGCPAQTV